MPKTIALALTGMHCQGCVRRVGETLRNLPGVQVDSVEVGSAQLTFDPGKTTAAQIIEAVDRIGFSARIEE